MKKFIILDSFALIFRAYYAYPPTLTTSDGQPINAAYGFSALFLEILKKFKPDYIVAVFDSSKPTIRSTEFTQYKANRKETDIALTSQIPKVAEIMNSFDVPVLSVDGYEADDIIATLVQKFSEHSDLEKIVVTGDQDLFQLINPSTSIYLAGSKFSASKIYQRQEVFDKLGVWPEQVPTYKSLAGDSSDNIPGVAGIGPKTAVELIQSYQTLDQIYQNLDKIKESTTKKLMESYEIAQKSLELATVNRDVPVSFQLDDAQLHSADPVVVKKLFTELRFNSLIKKLDDLNGLFAKPVQSEQFGLLDSIEIEAASFLSLPKLKQANSEVFAIDFDILNLEKLPRDWRFGSVYASDGEFDYQLTADKAVEFFELCQGKRLICANYKNFLHVLNNYFDSTKLKSLNIQFEDLGFATQILSAGKFNTSIPHIFSFSNQTYSQSKQSQARSFFDIFQIFAQDLNASEIYKLEKNIVPVIVQMEREGIAFDQDVCQQMYLDVSTRKLDLQTEIFDIVGYEFNLNSPKQVGEALFQKRGLIPVGKTKGGAFATDESSLKKLKDLDPVVNLVLEYREVDKILSTYISALPKYVQNGRIHSTFDQMGAISGRFSSKNPNLQNIPTGEKARVNIRNLFIPQEGFEFITFDYSQQELRLLAALAGEEKMIEVFNNNLDIHAVTASELFGVDISKVTKEQRSVGKVINFSIVYGVSGYGLSENLGVDVSTANELIRKFYAEYPNLKQYFENQKTLLAQQNYLETSFGRRRSSENFASLNKFAQQAVIRELLNFPIQGTAADLMKEAMVKIQDITANFDARLLLQIHDEFLFEFKGTEAQRTDFVHQIKSAMEAVRNIGISYKVDVKFGMRWGSMK